MFEGLKVQRIKSSKVQGSSKWFKMVHWLSEYRVIVSLSGVYRVHYIIVSLIHCIIVPLYHCTINSLYHCFADSSKHFSALQVFYCSYFTSLPLFTFSVGDTKTSLPSRSSAIKIMPCDSMPRSLRGFRLTKTETCFPTIFCGS